MQPPRLGCLASAPACLQAREPAQGTTFVLSVYEVKGTIYRET
jgi:hypothetical protein